MPPFKTCKRQQECINYEEQIEIILVLLASELWGSLSVEMIVANSAAVELMTVSSGHQSDIISFIMSEKGFLCCFITMTGSFISNKSVLVCWGRHWVSISKMSLNPFCWCCCKGIWWDVSTAVKYLNWIKLSCIIFLIVHS